MASVSGVSSSNTSSIYGSRNVLSGLATGLDTESMIENAVSGFQTKIASLQKRQTSLTWKQEAMRGVSTPMIQFAQKYTSYSSSTNLLSANFFNKAVTTAANGKYADKISATGKSSSSVRILDVTKLATRATYSVSAAAMGLGGSADGKAAAMGTEKLELDAAMSLSRVSGTLSLQYGANRTIDISFDEVEDLYTAENGKSAAQAFVDSINKKLAGTKVSNSSGEYVAASTMVEAKLDDNGNVVFSDKAGAGNSVTIAGATGKLKDNLGIDASSASSKAGTIVLADDFAFVDESAHRGEYLAGKSLKITLDGKTKTVELPGYEASDTAESYAAKLNDALQKSFGSSIGAELTSDGKLSFTFRSVDQAVDFTAMSRLLFKIERYRGEGAAAGLFYEAKVTEAVVLTVDAWKQRGRQRERPLSAEDAQSLQNAVSYIADHCAASIPLERLAAIACMSESKLKGCFQRQFGCSVTQYIQGRRMSQAEHLLVHTDLTMGQIVRTIGCTTSSRFAELFRKSTGILPVEYRKLSRRA